MSTLAKLKSCKNLADLAELLGFKTKSLSYLIWGTPHDAKYSEFEIPKRSGGKRAICAPNSKLKFVQARLSEILQECEKEIEHTNNVKRSLSHGFKKGCSILTNAERHRRRSFVLNIDLKDFFGTINFGRVRGFFIKNRHFALDPEVATVIAQIACHDNKLPQGSPCSPIISNLLGSILDVRLGKLAKSNGCAYTRYADDITLSTSLPDLPTDLAFSNVNSHQWTLGKPLVNAITACGFRINESKTRVQYRRSRQDVTGIVVNRHLNVRTEYRNKLRAMVHHLRANGTFFREQSQLNADGDTVTTVKEGSRAQLRGMLSFVLQVEQWRNRHIDLPRDSLSANEWLMRDFLFYTMFANPDQPSILCEGKTDSIYIKEAIKSLGSNFPTLVKSGSHINELKVNLIRNNHLLERLFGLSGGESHLKEFVRTYRDQYRQIKGPRGSHPLIVLFDNDTGAAEVLNILKNIFKIKICDGQQYFHVHDNLYVALTSPIGTGPHYIEQCFDAKTLAEPLGGKTFSPTNKKLAPNEYGKGWFAEKVVAPKAKSINFSGFTSLLAQLSSIVETHAASHPSS